MVGPQVFMATAMKGRPEARQFSNLAEPLAPLGLLGFTLLFVFTSAGEAAVAFTPAEVNLLFAAPFTRRELLLYKLAKTGLALIFVSAFMSMTTLVYLRSWLSGFVGFLLATAMMQLMGMVRLWRRRSWRSRSTPGCGRLWRSRWRSWRCGGWPRPRGRCSPRASPAS